MSGLSPEWITTHCPLAIEDRGLHTRLTVISYQYSNTFGAGGDVDFLYHLFVRDTAGQLVLDRPIGLLRPNQVWQAELADLLAEAGRDRLSAGSLTLAARPANSNEVNAIRIPQFEIDLHSDDGQWEAVHSKGFNPQYWYPAEFGFARIVESATYASYLAIQNFSLDQPADPAYTLLRADGTRRPAAATGPIPPGGSAMLPLADLFPGLPTDLGGRFGALLIDPRGSRVLPYLFIQHRSTGAFSVDHYSMPV